MDSKAKWAVVTGASSGIGSVFARSAAERGYSVVLVARRRDRLDALAKELERKGVGTVVVTADLGDPAGVDLLAAATKQKGIVPDLLFNNAGYGTNGAFLDVDVDRELAMIDLNCRSLTALAHHYGKQMRARGRGTIVNVASVVSFLPTPYLSVYAATKAFVLSFSQALAVELRPAGVHVVALCPGATRTEFAKVANFEGAKERPATYGQSAEDVVRTAWRAIDGKRPVAVSGAGNRLSVSLFRLAPQGLLAKIAGSRLRPKAVRT